ncbi:MAG: hypothetical protein R6W78_10390 [Bacteroidales bacterium]
MASNYESGHAKNVANLGKLISSCSGYGEAYNPGNASLTISSLNTLLENAENSVNAVNAAIPGQKNAIAARRVAFNKMSDIASRIVNALKSSGVNDLTLDNASSLLRKIRGRRSSALHTEEEKKALAAEGKETKQVSASQTSFDNRLDNFDKLIKLAVSVPQYTPNEAELSSQGLEAFLSDLKTKNAAVVEATTSLNNSRMARNGLLYSKGSGLVDTAMAVKAYVKSAFGAGDPRYRQISKLSFKGYKV